MKPTISYDDFSKLDIRVGTIISATAPEWSEKLLRFEVDLGEEIGTKIILSGIKAWYQPEEFVGKQYIFVVNLAERKMGPEFSQGMMLMADGDQPVPMALPTAVENGTVFR